MFVGQFQDACRSVKRVHHRFQHIHPMVNHFYNQLIMRKHTSRNTTDNVSSTLLSDFVPEVPSSRCQHKHPVGQIFGFKPGGNDFPVN